MLIAVLTLTIFGCAKKALDSKDFETGKVSGVILEFMFFDLLAERLDSTAGEEGRFVKINGGYDQYEYRYKTTFIAPGKYGVYGFKQGNKIIKAPRGKYLSYFDLKKNEVLFLGAFEPRFSWKKSKSLLLANEISSIVVNPVEYNEDAILGNFHKMHPEIADRYESRPLGRRLIKSEPNPNCGQFYHCEVG